MIEERLKEQAEDEPEKQERGKADGKREVERWRQPALPHP